MTKTMKAAIFCVLLLAPGFAAHGEEGEADPNIDRRNIYLQFSLGFFLPLYPEYVTEALDDYDSRFAIFSNITFGWAADQYLYVVGKVIVDFDEFTWDGFYGSNSVTLGLVGLTAGVVWFPLLNHLFLGAAVGYGWVKVLSRDPTSDGICLNITAGFDFAGRPSRSAFQFGIDFTFFITTNTLMATDPLFYPGDVLAALGMFVAIAIK